MAVVGPHVTLSDLVRWRQMHGARCPDKEAAGCGNHHGPGSPQKSSVNRTLVPQSVRYMLREPESQIPCILRRHPAFPHLAVQYGVKLGQSPERRINGAGFSDEVSNPERFRFVEIEFCDVCRVEIH